MTKYSIPQTTLKSTRRRTGFTPKTGKAYDNRFCSIITVKERKVVHWRDYMDSLAARCSFKKAVKERDSEKVAKGFSSWSHFVCLLFAQLAGASSLREVAGGLAGALGKLNHLGIFRSPSKSTLSYASVSR